MFIFHFYYCCLYATDTDLVGVRNLFRARAFCFYKNIFAAILGGRRSENRSLFFKNFSTTIFRISMWHRIYQLFVLIILNIPVNSNMVVFCRQVNLQKSRQASTLLSGVLASSPLISFLQEPYTVENKVVIRPAGYKVIPEATCDGVPRAALFIPSNIQAVSLGHLNNPDCAVAQIRWNALEILIASVYLDIDDDVDQPWLSGLVEYADSRNMAVVICMDSNAHSSMYSDAISDERGGQLEDFILMHNLDIANLGHVPTFQTFRAQSVIDVTLVKYIVSSIETEMNLHCKYLQMDPSCSRVNISYSP